MKNNILSSFYNSLTGKGKSRQSGKKKVLFLFWHGLGDNILVTPVIRRYKQTTGNFVGWAMPRKFRSAALFESNPYIDQLHWTSDAWHDFKNYSQGCKRVIKEGKAIKKEFGYDELCVIFEKNISKHKIYWAADMMGVDLNNDLHTEVYYDPEKIKHLYMSISLPEEYVFFHGKTAAQSKDLSLEKAKEWLSQEGIDLPIVSPDFSWNYQEYPIAFAMDVMKKAKYIVVADSVMYHAAHAMDLYVALHTDKENVVFAL
jgi:hypothetical protein